MKLSEAMMLGSTTCKMVRGDWNSCAIGAAGNAVGIPAAVPGYLRIRPLLNMWPWLEGLAVGSHAISEASTNASDVGSCFDAYVCRGKWTYEQLVDYVRSIEPSCGECNRFECSCVKSEAVPEAIEEAACSD